jgi:hypothetical protein
VWAFSDESERADRMLVGVVLIPTGALDTARSRLRGLLLPGQRRIHTSNESSRRRRALLDTLARIENLTGVVLAFRRPPGTDRVAGRRRLLTAATEQVVHRGVTAWILDDLPPSQRMRDRASVEAALRVLTTGPVPVYDHRRSHTEPLLWAADALCWAAGSGGDWWRRVSGLAEVQEVP